MYQPLVGFVIIRVCFYNYYIIMKKRNVKCELFKKMTDIAEESATNCRFDSQILILIRKLCSYDQ